LNLLRCQPYLIHKVVFWPQHASINATITSRRPIALRLSSRVSFSRFTQVSSNKCQDSGTAAVTKKLGHSNLIIFRMCEYLR
jgi:hypothetical protein